MKAEMSKKQRVYAAFQHEGVDRVPFSVYQHSSVRERTVEKFTVFTIDFFRKYDPDYIKVMFDEHYDLPVTHDFIDTIQVWRELEVLNPHCGAFARQLEALKRIKKQVGKDVPVIQTIFLPFHFAVRLAGRRILQDLKEEPQLVSYGLNAIAESLVAFARACRDEAAVDGFFYGAFGCEEAWMTQAEYQAQVMPTDLKVVKSLEVTPLSILHIHGESRIHFNLLKEYPVKAISWEDRSAGPSLAQAREVTDKCLVGGIDHLAARTCGAAEIIRQGREAAAALGARGFVLAPGCTFFPDTPPQNMAALKKAVEK